MEILHESLERLHRIFCLSLAILCCSILAALVCMDIVQAAMRYLFDSSLPSIVDVNLLMLQGFAWASAVLLWLKQKHLAVDFFSGRLLFTRYLWIPSNLVLLIGIMWLVPDALNMMKIYHGLSMPALTISASIRVLPMLLGLVFLGFAAFLNILLFVTAHRLKLADA